MGFTSLMLIALSPRSCPPAICSLRHGRQQLLDLPVPRKRLMTRTPRPRSPRLRRNMTLLPTQMMANLGVRPFPSADPGAVWGCWEAWHPGDPGCPIQKESRVLLCAGEFRCPSYFVAAGQAHHWIPALPRQDGQNPQSCCCRTPLHTDACTHKRFYTQKLLHTDAFTRRHFDAQRLLHTEAFTQRLLYTQTLLHKETFTHRGFYTQTLLHTDAFTHKHFYTQRLLHTDAFTHRRFYTQTLLHTEAFTHKHFSRTEVFTHKSFHIQKLLHTNTFTHRDRTREIAILPQFLASNVHFVRKGCGGHLKIAIFTWFLTSNVHFVHIDSAGCVVYQLS